MRLRHAGAFFHSVLFGIFWAIRRGKVCEWLIGGSFAAFRRTIWVAFNLLLSYFNNKQWIFGKSLLSHASMAIQLHLFLSIQALWANIWEKGYIEVGLVTKFYVTWVKLLSSICQIIKCFEWKDPCKYQASFLLHWGIWKSLTTMDVLNLNALQWDGWHQG